MIVKLNILLFTSVSAWMDLKWWKVKNYWILADLAGGVLFGFFSPEAPGAAEGMAGLFLPLILLGGLYHLGKIGAGDIKLFMAAGLWMGSTLILKFMLFAMAAGSVYFATLLIRKGDVRSLLNRKIHVAVCAFASAVLFVGGVYH